jgi:hypothetical protein
MTDLKQSPIRLLEDPSVSDALRRDLELASSHAPITFDIEAGLARFEQARFGTKLNSTAGTTLRVLGWVIGATVLLGGAFEAASLIGQDDAPRISSGSGAMAPAKDTDLRSEDGRVAGLTSSLAREPGEPVAEAGHPARVGDAGAALAQPEGGDPALDAPKPPRPDTSHPDTGHQDTGDSDTSHADTGPQTPSLADEAAQINAARKVLAEDPAKALALMQAAELQFPNGAMIQERRGYAILALVALGRTAEAEEQADAYLERWPNGPLSRRVRDALGR